MRAIALGMWLVARSLTGGVTAPTAAQEAKLAAAVRALNDLNDEDAHALLKQLLAMSPPDLLAARAYIYLGVLDFNALDAVRGREELRHALELDPTIDVPPLTSPKIALAFGEIRQQMIKKMARAAPADAVEAPPAVAGQDERSLGSRVWPWVFVGTAALAAGVSTWGWIQVSSFESLKNPSTVVSVAQAQSSHSAASTGEAVGIIGLVAVAGLATGAVLTW
jgi:hypothetical protein